MEKAILFSGEMVRAILDGRKTQTRRVMKPQPDLTSGEWRYAGWSWQKYMGYPLGHDLPPSPWGVMGNRMWVRETWQAAPRSELEFGGRAGWYEDVPKEFRVPDTFIHTYYRADKSQYVVMPTPDGDYLLSRHEGPDLKDLMPPKWRPSIFMPKWASRITLEISGALRVQRIQEITDKDVIAEGVDTNSLDRWYSGDDTPRGIFGQVWDSINEKRGYGWEVNPFVWVIDFRVI